MCLNTNFKRDTIILTNTTEPDLNFIKLLFVWLETAGDHGGPLIGSAWVGGCQHQVWKDGWDGNDSPKT